MSTALAGLLAQQQRQHDQHHHQHQQQQQQQQQQQGRPADSLGSTACSADTSSAIAWVPIVNTRDSGRLTSPDSTAEPSSNDAMVSCSVPHCSSEPLETKKEGNGAVHNQSCSSSGVYDIDEAISALRLELSTEAMSRHDGHKAGKQPPTGDVVDTQVLFS